MKKFSLTFLLVPMLCVGMLISDYAYAERGVTVKPKQGASPQMAANAKYHAIIIGNNNYKNLPKLKTAINDAKEVERILKSQYGFETKLLIDATRNEILDGLNEMREKVGAKDNLLIYYAGHGEFLKEADKSYWLPVDAHKDRTTNWIIADDITSSIKLIASKHILVVSDSCYSGTLTRAATAEIKNKTEREEFINKMMDRPSRTLMASGGNEPVADSGGGNNSVFAAAFLKALKEADKPLFTAEELFHGRVKEIVAGKSEQVPQYDNIKNSGHEGGDFVFSLRTASLGAVSTPTPPSLPPSPPAEASMPPAPVVLQGHLQVNVNAPSARVFISGEERGTASPGSPLNMENLSTGTLTVRVEAEGFNPMQKTVTIQRNQWTQEVFELKRIQVASLQPPPPIDQPKSRLAEKDNMVMIPAGEFMAGEPNSLKGMVLNAFYIDKYEVTQREFQQVMGNNPSAFKGCDNCPVEQVTWYEANEYCGKVGKRLPTEWEWEKAAKAGTTTTYYWGNEVGVNNANCNGCGSQWDNKKTAPVGSFKPNGYGLYDMAGNVWEWTASDNDGSGKYKTLRGGSWFSRTINVRPSGRDNFEPDNRNNRGGFRCSQ